MAWYFFTEDFASSPRNWSTCRTVPVAVSKAVSTSALVSDSTGRPCVVSHCFNWIGEFAGGLIGHKAGKILTNGGFGR